VTKCRLNNTVTPNRLVVNLLQPGFNFPSYGLESVSLVPKVFVQLYFVVKVDGICTLLSWCTCISHALPLEGKLKLCWPQGTMMTTSHISEGAKHNFPKMKNKLACWGFLFIAGLLLVWLLSIDQIVWNQVCFAASFIWLLVVNKRKQIQIIYLAKILELNNTLMILMNMDSDYTS